MSKQDDGGPAYPCKVAVGDVSITKGGMSLRDYFAGQALAGLMPFLQNNKDSAACGEPVVSLARVDWLAMLAYMQADAMLKARQE